MGKRLGRTQALLALVLLYQLSQPSYASAGFFDWLASKNVSAMVVQPLESNTVSFSENTWNNSGVSIEESEDVKPTIKKEPLAAIQADIRIKDDFTKEPLLVLEGEASYYSWDGCLGCNPARIMANGKVLNDNALTMAIGADKKHLVGRQARVTNLSSGKSALVLITDTGGFYQAKYGHRVADLTIATKQAISMTGGLAQVRVEVF